MDTEKLDIAPNNVLFGVFNDLDLDTKPIYKGNADDVRPTQMLTPNQRRKTKEISVLRYWIL